MGGDHKCPVCQATFTRPQHVARHMRSHTGDRPYKCQYCGDQFARSDLLSRHVNKCHASEKPLPGATNGRRKGTTSLSRATTSKQACDQCVQSSLPCDGSNPCTKCVQRKYRCTYVKFHRQTAPVGPGHNPAAAKGDHIPPAHHHPASHHLSSSAVLGLSNVPAVNISLGPSLGHGGGGGLSDLGLGPARFPGSSGAYPSTSPVDDFYHLPPPNGYTGSGAPGAAGDPYSPAYTTSRMMDDDVYGPRPGTASSAGSSSTHGSSVGSVNGQWNRNVYSAAAAPGGGGPERLEPRSLHGLSGPGGYSSSSHQRWSGGVPPPTHHQHHHSHSGGHSVGGHGGGGYAHAGAPPHDLEDLEVLNAQAQTFRDLFPDEFTGPHPNGGGGPGGGSIPVPGSSAPSSHDYGAAMANASPLVRPGDGGMSDGGGSNGSDGGHSVSGSLPRTGGSFGRRRGFELTKPGDPYALQFRRPRAGSTASSSSSRPSTQHGYDSIAPSPLIASQPLAPGQPGSATNPTFSNAFGSLTLDDANALASLGGALADGRTNLPQNDPDATPLGVPFEGRGSVLLGGGDTGGSVSSSLASNASTSLSSASTGNTSARSDGPGSLPGFSPIVRPLSSLAAYPPSTYLNQTWQHGAAQQAAMGNVTDDNLFAWGAGGYGGTGWTPGLANLDDFSFDGGSGSGSGSDGSSGLPPPSGFAGIPSGLTPTPGKEDGGKDLKEFWKMYMRTPLTGPGQDPLGASAGTTPGPNVAGGSAGTANAPATTTPFRRPRVASMPSSNAIPRAHRDGAVAHLQHLQAQLQQQKALGPMSSIRTTLHGPLGDGSSQPNTNVGEDQQDVRGPAEDLSSYGAAVMARKTPVNLSLARALGRMKKQQQQAAQAQSGHHRAGSTTTDGSDSPLTSSRESSVGFAEDVPMLSPGVGAAPAEHVVRPRPSVKRLASSVLESDIHKVGRFEEGAGSEDSTPKPNKDVAAPKPSAPFAVPDAGDGMKKTSMGMFPPPASLGAGSMMPPPPTLGLGPRPPSLLERRSRMAQAQQAQVAGTAELQ